MMAVRKRGPPPGDKPKPTGPDFGPTIRLRTAAKAKGRRDPGRLIDKEDRLDPTLAATTGGLVRGGRVRDPVLVMLTLHRITKPQYDSVEAFRDDVALANGARPDQVESAGVRTAYSGGNWPSDTQLNAMGRVARTWDHLTPPQQRLASHVIVDRRSMDEFSGMRRDEMPDLFQAILRVLVLRHRQRADERDFRVARAKGGSGP